MLNNKKNEEVLVVSQNERASLKIVSVADEAADYRVNYNIRMHKNVNSEAERIAVYRSLRSKPIQYISTIKEEISGGSSLTLRLSEKVPPALKQKNFILRNRVLSKYTKLDFAPYKALSLSDIDYRVIDTIDITDFDTIMFAQKSVMIRDIKNNCTSRYVNKLRFVTTEDLVLQSGFLDEKAVNRELYHNSRYGRYKQNKKQKLSDLYAKQHKRPKDQVINAQIKSVKEKMEIQFGIKDLFDSKDIYCHAENLISLIVAIQGSTSILQFVCILNLYLGCYFDNSRTLQIVGYARDLFNFGAEGTIQMETQVATLHDIKALFNNYSELRHCESAQKLHKLISYILALGLCGCNNLKFTLGSFEIFHLQATKNNPSLLDIADVVFQTAIYFVERGHQVFSTGDPWQLLYGDSALVEFEKKFSYVNSFVSLVETGNLEHLPESVDSFEDKVLELKEEISKMLAMNPSGSYRQILVVKLNTIDKINVRLLQARKNVSIREKPYSFLLFGATSVGKSTMTNIILNQLMRINGFDPDPKKINSLNASDQYQSDYRSDSTCVIFDDIANATLQTAKGNHCQLIIDFINNNPKCALKAGVEQKGACFIRPKIVVGTTNVKSLLSHQYSNEPLSIVRRFDVTITVAVKPEYCQAGSHMIDMDKVPPGHKDCWLFDVERVVPCSRGSGATVGIGYELVVHNGHQLGGIEMKELLQYLSYASKKHFEQQRELVLSSHSVFDIPSCPRCEQYPEFCDCLETQVNPLLNLFKDVPTQETRQKKNNIFVPDWAHSLMGLNDTIVAIYDKTSVCIDFIKNLEQYASFEQIHEFHSQMRNSFPVLTYTLIWPFILVMCLFGLMFSSTYVFFFFLLSLIKLLKTFNWFCESKLKAFALYDNSLVLFQQYNTEKNRRNIKIGILGVVSVVALKKLYDVFRAYNVLKMQGSEYETPTPQLDEKPQNEWKKPFVAPVPRSNKSWSTTSSALANMVAENIAYFEYTVLSTGKHYFSDAFPLKSNLWLINNHALVDGSEIEALFVRHDPAYHGGNFRTTISPYHTLHIPDTDLALIYVPTGGDNKNMLDYFPLEFKNIKTPANLIHKNDRGVVTRQRVCAKPGYHGTDDIDVHGYSYKTEIPTFKGMCMAALIADEIGPVILGFHFAGNTGGYKGAASAVTRSQLMEACDMLSRRTGVLISHSTGDMELRNVGPYKNVQMMGDIHDHSPLNFQEEGAIFRAFGRHDGPRKTYRSNVETTLISDSVAEIMGQDNIWGAPPNMKGWETWNRDLSNMTHPKELVPTVLVCATKDYEASLLQDLSLERIKRVSPLSNEAALAGADGVYGIDSVNMQSSCGAPINKPKNKILERSAIPVKGISQPIYAPDFIWKEVDILKGKLLKKERIYVQFTACLKDEPTKNTKKKTRVFCGCPIAATILIRQLYLPLCKLIMENSETFECAVGINAHGKDWDNLTKHIVRFGSDRMVAGDYSDYDSTMPAAITLSSFGILINIARIAGYSEEQLVMMQGLATEMCYPVYEYNGEFIQIQGTNPSGHPLTVFINSMCNSLFMRYAFYQIYSFDNKTLFRDFVSLMTYGDDNVMSVSVERPLFNHTKIAEVLAASDIKYTMADKSANSRPYIHLSNVSFLKRSFVWSEEFSIYIAPIEELSLFKTLHSALKSKELSREQHSAQAIDCVLREWFYYGEHYFNEKRKQLIEIATRHQLLHHFDDNELYTYDDLKSSFINKYLTEDINRGSDPHVGVFCVEHSSTLIP